jgi:glycosyltransferase involved in cell wall biosynthesis
MEAMAAGKACVATSASRIEDNRNGILAKPNDPDSLADAMARLVDSPHLRERLAYAARELAVAEFDHRTAVRAYESLYGRLLTQSELAMAHSG